MYVKYPCSCTHKKLPKAVSNSGFTQLTRMLLSGSIQSLEEATPHHPPCCRKRQLLLHVFAWHRKSSLGFAATDKIVLTEPVGTPGKVSRGRTQWEGLQQGISPSGKDDHFRECLTKLDMTRSLRQNHKIN